MSDQGATAFPSQTMVECGICGETLNVNWFCKNCPGSICETCYQAHQRATILKHHLVVPRTLEVLRLHGPAKNAEICRLHPTKEISTYCNDCNIPCCVLCLVEKHKQHDFSPIEDKYLSAEKNLDQYIRDLKTDVKPSLDDTKESLNQRLHNHEVQIEKVKEEINSYRLTLKQKVDDSCDLLLKELDKAKYDFRKFEDELESSKEKIDQLIKDVEIMIGKGKLDMIEYIPPNHTSLIPQSPLPILKLPNFVPGNELIDMIQNKIGKIEFKEHITDDMNTMKGKTSPNRVLDGESKEKTPSGVKQRTISGCLKLNLNPGNDLIDMVGKKIGKIEFKEHITDDMNTMKWKTSRDRVLEGESKEKSPSRVKCIYKSDNKITKVKSFASKFGVTSLTTAGNNSAWVMYYNSDTMYLYDWYGDVVRSVKVKNSTGINDMVITRSGDMIVTCRDNKVRRVSVGGNVSTLINTERYEPGGVCLTDKEEIVVCMWNVVGSRLVVYCGRSKVRDIRGVDSQGKPQITNPYRVVCNDNDLCVVNQGRNVVCVDESDNVRWMYDGKQARLFDPCGIYLDKYHNLLVTDYNSHCVHYIDREGGLIQVILTQEQTGLKYPWGICVDDETGHVWVGSGDGCFVVQQNF